MCEQLIPGPFQELTVEGGCLLWRMQVVIPKKSQGQILTKTTQELALGSPLQTYNICCCQMLHC